MENKTINERQRKFLLVVPILVVPFLAMLFWALGGGNASAQAGTKQLIGLNTKLPGAKIKSDSSEDKLSFYQKAEKDSLKNQQARKDDPYYQDSAKVHLKDSTGIHDTGIIPRGNEGKGIYTVPALNNSRASLSSNERQINERLAALNRQINQPAPAVPQNGSVGASDSQTSQLRERMQNMTAGNAPDPQMEQMSRMLDKIEEIQNPALVQQKLIQQSQKNRGQVFPVTTNRRDNSISTLDNGGQSSFAANEQQNGFYSLDNPPAPDTPNAIEAVVHETQTVVAGSTVKLRLLNDVYINGTLIPKDNFVFGTASLNGERLTIKISSIRYRNSIFPVELAVSDIDGVDGIYIPGAITRDVAKESADQGVQNIGLTSYDPSLGAQAATAGISAAKTLFSRKVRLVKVTIKAGYQVLLRDEKQKQTN